MGLTGKSQRQKAKNREIMAKERARIEAVEYQRQYSDSVRASIAPVSFGSLSRLGGVSSTLARGAASVRTNKSHLKSFTIGDWKLTQTLPADKDASKFGLKVEKLG